LLLNGEECSKQELRDFYAPYQDGKLLSVPEQGNKIAEWSKYFLGDEKNDGHYHIRGEVPQFHRDIYQDLASDYRHYYISAPSEFAKTTTTSLIYPLYRIYYWNEPYIVLSSRVDDTAVELMDELKHEISDNDKLIEVYGELKGEGKAFAWSDHEIELRNGSSVRAIGWGGNVRARKKKGFRITLWIGDDPEEVADLRSKAILDDHKTWLVRSVLKRLDKEFGKARLVGTLIGLGGTMDYVTKHPDWHGRVYRALTPDDKPIEKRTSIWESRWPTPWLHGERKKAQLAGELDVWMFERMNEPISALTRNLKGYKFFQGEFKRHNDQNLLFLDGMLTPIPIYTYHAIDPAFSKAETADERAQVTFGMGYLPMDGWRKPTIWVLEYDFDHKDPDTIIERALDLHRKYFYRELVVETVGGQKVYEFLGVKQMMKDPFLLKHPLTPTFVPYQARNKEDRIYHYFKNITRHGQLFIRPDMPELQNELDLFLQSRHLHLLDALEMGGRFAVPCDEKEQSMNPRGRNYKEVHRDKTVERLEKTGRRWLLF